MPTAEKEYWVTCASCGNMPRSHKVLYKKVILSYDEPEGMVISRENHRMLECGGCKTIKYAISTEEHYEFDSPYGDHVVSVYPDEPGKGNQRLAGIKFDASEDDKGESLIPEIVWKMYKETLDALNANIRTLAGAGIRATVEAICVDKGIIQGNLQGKIDELGTRRFLGDSEAEFLHEQRHLGNAAVHELETPTTRDLNDSLDIVEGLIRNIYIYPSHSKRLKEKREAKKKKTAP
jgi:Domain of unknown function (DUF4145)